MKDDTKELFREDWQAIKEAREEKIFAEVSEYLEDKFATLQEKWKTEGKSLKWPKKLYEEYLHVVKHQMSVLWTPYHGMWVATMAYPVFWNHVKKAHPELWE